MKKTKSEKYIKKMKKNKLKYLFLSICSYLYKYLRPKLENQ